ncbi:ferredoxin [Nocardia goodfellowii]|uniref:Ferredoxin n=1 Tax=Nocardia goodfellowii TaxID=882446 RepID=A0ABS4QDG2_9NOCA|nr:ferredoxin [Nocardia goodfellowii]MBP2189724.1 NAD-dependent dihydropyrimidine dehydrogenase PreA subunit [Nocardia goodfellowii]
MTFVIGAACVDVLDRACIEECPLDCIYVGDRMAYINPAECTDCSACEPACPVEAIYYEDDMPAGEEVFVVENARFFEAVLPGRTSALGDPGGATNLGAVGVDTAYVASYRPEC